MYYAHPPSDGVLPVCFSMSSGLPGTGTGSGSSSSSYTPCGGFRATKLQCRNCNLQGHVFRNCNSPTISYGVIVARRGAGNAGNAGNAGDDATRYLLIQRQDSLSYIDFVRGKYHPQNLDFLKQLFRHMTDDERALIADPSTDFAALWAAVWHRPVGSHQGHEFVEARANFEALRTGYALRVNPRPACAIAYPCAIAESPTALTALNAGVDEDGSGVVVVSLANLVAGTASMYPTEREWGFPKGRRKLKESDAAAAVREFSEETLYAPTDIELLPGVKPIEETFQGTNGVRYRHVYFVARMKEPVGEPAGQSDARNVREQAREVREVRWCTRDDVLARLRPYNVERRHLFSRVADMIESREWPGGSDADSWRIVGHV